MKKQDDKSEQEWKQQLSAEQYHICRQKGTEPPFSGEYWNCKKEGTYECVCCGSELFSSETKYDSGTGWPSFWAPQKAERIATQLDRSHFMLRIEVLCEGCGSHLGHLFDDGPTPTGQRYCINSASLQLRPKK